MNRINYDLAFVFDQSFFVGDLHGKLDDLLTVFHKVRLPGCMRTCFSPTKNDTKGCGTSFPLPTIDSFF